MRRVPALLALSAAAFASLAACSSVDPGRSPPARFSATVPSSWERVTDCLAHAYAPTYRPDAPPAITEYETATRAVAPERRAQVALYPAGTQPGPAAPAPVGLFDVSGSDGDTVVTWRRRAPSTAQESIDTDARQVMGRCGNA